MLENKNILLGISGGIAAFKSAQLASMLKKSGANVFAVMTENAQKFITPLTFETLTNNEVATDTFMRGGNFDVQHVSLAKKADIAVIAPATANIIAKFANGIADDMLSTTYLALKCPVIIAPAMNTAMYEHPATQNNIKILRERGNIVLNTGEGILACGDSGKGRMAEPQDILFEIENALCEKDLQGKNILVTAGATKEAIDPVRYISNHSSGKMGCAIARRAKMRGANVTLVCGDNVHESVYGVEKVCVFSAQDMYNAVVLRKGKQDIIIKCAAVADYKSGEIADKKIKKSDNMTLDLVPTVDILSKLGEEKEGYYLVGFAAETNNVVSYAKGKLERKKLDMIVANDVSDSSIGFGSDKNAVTIITKSGKEISVPSAQKEDVADIILDEIIKDL